jgi:transcriptional regulator with XRE-family HTH domain
MAQMPAELRPQQSPRHYLGAELRAWRQLRQFSLARLGRMVHVSGDLLGKVEKAQRWPSEDLIRRCDSALGAAGTLTRLLELARVSQSATAVYVGSTTTFEPTPARGVRRTEDAAMSGLFSDAGRSARVVSLADHCRRKMASAS